MKYAKPIDEVMGAIINNVGNRLLTQLQEENNSIRCLNYLFGHPQEIITTLAEMSKSSLKYNKFPLIMVFADVISGPSSVKGLGGDVNLNMVICMPTDAKYKAATRITKNFVPILRPIYTQLIEEMFRSGYFWVQTPRQLLGRDIERLFWGKTGVQGNDANTAMEFIDAIEVKGLKVTQTYKGSQAISIPQTVWRTVNLFIKDNPDPTNVIPVGAGKFIYAEYATGPTLTPLQVDTNLPYLAASAQFPQGKMVEFPFYYSNEPNTLPNYDRPTGVWDESADGNFSDGAFVMIKFLDNV